MAKIEDVFEGLRHRVRSEAKLDWIAQIENFFEKHVETLEERLRDRDRQFVSISFDRRKNDEDFSYAFADLLLKALDLTHGGTGVRRPVNQLRVIRWGNTRASLRDVLVSAKATFPEFKFRGVLTLPYKPVGNGLDPSFMNI
jgi:hypothetical protein